MWTAWVQDGTGQLDPQVANTCNGSDFFPKLAGDWCYRWPEFLRQSSCGQWFCGFIQPLGVHFLFPWYPMVSATWLLWSSMNIAGSQLLINPQRLTCHLPLIYISDYVCRILLFHLFGVIVAISIFRWRSAPLVASPFGNQSPCLRTAEGTCVAYITYPYPMISLLDSHVAWCIP